MKKFVALIFCVFFLLNKTPSFAQADYYFPTPTPIGFIDPIPTSPPFDLKDCACNTSTDNGSKTCKPAQGTKCAQGKVAVCQLNPDGGCNHALFGGGACVCKEPGAVTPPTTNEDGNFCTQQGFGALTSDPRVDTALGCIPVKMDKFIAWLLPVLFSISGGIAFLLMVYGFILITTSNGDPKAVQGAKETITSAVIGLLISIFAIFILRLIAFDILHIPGIS